MNKIKTEFVEYFEQKKDSTEIKLEFRNKKLSYLLLTVIGYPFYGAFCNKLNIICVRSHNLNINPIKNGLIELRDTCQEILDLLDTLES